MTLDRGVTHGRMPSTPARRGRLHLVALPTLLVAIFMVGVLVASLGSYGDGGVPDGTSALHSPDSMAMVEPSPEIAPTPSASPSPSASSPAGSPTPAAGVLLAGVTDPFQLPRFPGARVVGVDQGIDGSVSWTLIVYEVGGASQDDVREHYRAVFRETDWFVGDVDFVNDTWSFSASQGDREAQLEIALDTERVRVSAYVSEPAPAAGPTPTPTPKATRKPTPRPEPRAVVTRDQSAPRTRMQPRDDDPPRVSRQKPRTERAQRPPREDRDDDDRDDGDDDDGDDGGSDDD